MKVRRMGDGARNTKCRCAGRCVRSMRCGSQGATCAGQVGARRWRAMDVGEESLLAPPRKFCEAQERTKVLVWDAGHARKDVSLATAEAGEIVTRCAAP